MKSDIHPQWNNNTKVTCSCGASFTTGSTLDSIHVDICSQCHPFYTGEMKFVDVQGRVEKFQAKQKKGQTYQSVSKKKRAKKIAKDKAPVQSLKEMLTNIKEQTQSQEKPTSSPKKDPSPPKPLSPQKEARS